MINFEKYLEFVIMDHENLSVMPERVKYARKEAGFKSQTKIAEAMGISRERYAWYETERDMPNEHLPKFHKATSFNIHWLLTGEPETNNRLYDFRINDLNKMKLDAFVKTLGGKKKGWTPQKVQAIEKGFMSLSNDEAEHISKKFEVPASMLFTASNKSAPKGFSDPDDMQAYMHAPKEIQEAIKTMLQPYKKGE